jgi:creatinine amidohydrolase
MRVSVDAGWNGQTGSKMIEKLKIAQMTSAEVREHLTGEAVVLLPLGSIEDQGTHAPMGDFLAAECVALDIARAARKEGVPTFVAPVIPFGGRDAFISSYGGMSIRGSTLAALLEDVIGSLTLHGLNKILIINGHGGNVVPIADVTLKLRQDTGVFVASMYLWQIAYVLLQDMRGAEEAARSAGHGADPLTSVGLHYFPEHLRMDLAGSPQSDLRARGVAVTGFGQITYDGAVFQAPVTAAEAAPDGVWGGDPKLCNAQTGEQLASRLAAIGAGLIREHVCKGFPEG